MNRLDINLQPTLRQPRRGFSQGEEAAGAQYGFKNHA